MVNAHFSLADHLGIASAHAVVGSSIGGFQALEMALTRPNFARKLVLIATAARSQPWAIAFNESQRMAIETDASFGQEDPEAGKKGMRVSRSIGLLSYRGSSAYNATQQENDNLYKIAGFRATTYQQYQGDKLCRRFDAYSYYRLTQAFDSHNVGRYRGGIESCARIGREPDDGRGNFVGHDLSRLGTGLPVPSHPAMPATADRLAVRPRRVPGRIRQAERAAQTVHRYADGPVTSRYFHRECCFSAFFSILPQPGSNRNT